MELKAVQRADAIIAVGSKLRNWLIEDLGVDRRKLFLIPNGVDSNQFRPLDGSDLRVKLDTLPKSVFCFLLKHLLNKAE
jgi:glycosyltransferase involved in cell wall biosynthesis